MLKRKYKPNAFYYFMLDWKKQEESKGRRFSNGLKDVVADKECNELWKSLSVENKAYFKEKEKSNKIQIRNEKKTSLGESMAEINQAQIKYTKFLDNMKQYISSLIRTAKEINGIHRLKFFVVHVNYFCGYVLENNEIDYCPAEIAIAEFCLEKGVTRTYHNIVKSKIQLGYAYEALEHSKSTHQIPRDAAFGEEDYGIVFKEICNFLGLVNNSNVELPILYTCYEIESIKHPVISVLNMLCEFNKTSQFIIYSFEELFLNLYNIIFEENITKFDNSIASLKLKEDPFDYKRSIQCDFHKEIMTGGNYCSKSFVHRWVFVLCSYTCNFLDIILIPGCHIPIEERNVKSSTELSKTFENLNVNTSELILSTTPMANNSQKDDVSKKKYDEMPYSRLISTSNTSKIDYSIINREIENQFHVSTKMYHAGTIKDSEEDDFPSLGRGQPLKFKLG